MEQWLEHPYTILLARLVLGIVFLRSGIGKAFDQKQTIQTVIAYNVLPKSIAKVYGISLAWVELILAGLLLVGLWTKPAALGLTLLLLSFSVAVVINIVRRKDMDCGCSGRAAREKLSWRTLVRIALLLIMTIAVQRWDTGYFSLNQIFVGGSPNTTFFPPISNFLPLVLIVLFLVVSGKLAEATIAMFRDHKQLKQELSKQIALNLSEN